jgi:hypothetical protein
MSRNTFFKTIACFAFVPMFQTELKSLTTVLTYVNCLDTPSSAHSL